MPLNKALFHNRLNQQWLQWIAVGLIKIRLQPINVEPILDLWSRVRPTPPWGLTSGGIHLRVKKW